MKNSTTVSRSAPLAALSLYLAMATCVATAAEPSRARLTEGGVLITDADAAKAKFADCQPLKGERVIILNEKRNAGGSVGANVFEVVVADGRCKDVGGWVGVQRVEARNVSMTLLHRLS